MFTYTFNIPNLMKKFDRWSILNEEYLLSSKNAVLLNPTNSYPANFCKKTFSYLMTYYNFKI